MAFDIRAQRSDDPQETARRRAISRVLEAPADPAGAASGAEPLASNDIQPRTRTGSLGDLTGGNTGITGEMDKGPLVDAAAPTSAPAPTPYRASASDARLSGGWNREKLEGDHDSPKYQIARALLGNAGFDPTQGLRDEDLAALNATGLATFGRAGDSRDKVQLSGNIDPRFNGVSVIDLIQGLGTGAGKLNFEDANAAPAAGAAPAAPVLFDTGGYTGRPGASPVVGDSAYNNLLKRLQALTGGDPNQMALDQILGGGQ